MARKSGSRKVTPAMVRRMRGLRKEGLSYQKIAKRLNVAPMTVHNHLKKGERVGSFKKSYRKVVPIAVVIVAVSVVCAGYYLLTRRGVEFKTFTNENYSFKFDYPANWNFEELSDVPNPLVAYFGASENTGEGSIGLYIFDKTGYEDQFGISLDNLTSYMLSSENAFENNDNYVWIDKPTEIAIDDHHGVRYSYSVTDMRFAPSPLRVQVEVVVKDNYFYQFAMVASEENYSRYEPISEHVIDSFSFLD